MSPVTGKWCDFHEEIAGKTYFFEARITSIGNDGIGSYEFWGARGIDRGQDYVEEFEIRNICDEINRPLFKPDAKAVEDAIYSDPELVEKIAKALMDALVEEEPDEPDPFDEKFDKEQVRFEHEEDFARRHPKE